MVVPKRKQVGAAEFHIRALHELDALVSEHVMRERPRVHWEDADAQFEFDSLEEALEAMRDPLFKEIVRGSNREFIEIQEVQEFHPYSSQLGLAWKVIEHLGSENVKIERISETWRVAFGTHPETKAGTLGVAICLAALRYRGMDAVLEEELAEELEF